ncbi:group 1 glycosyl transferase [Cupriavidus sp. HMR-1]|nr:group 1 glycosyl transferase [Cupriavidus sp. HMR-1]
MIHGNLFARALTSFGSMPPLVCSAHSAREGGRLRALAYRLTDRWCALTTHVSQAGRNAMVQGGAIRADRITVMPNGIDTSRFAPEPSARQRVRQSLGLDASEIVLLSVGRLVAEKDHALLIDAFAEVLRTDLQIRLLIAGDGPLRNELQAQIGRLQLGHSVQLLGSREDIPDLLRSADVFVLSSNIEGMPLVVCEAMATGLPVVATDAAGVREIAGDLAIITPVGDRITLAQALQRAISRLPTAPGMRARYRERIIENFDVTTIARRWLAQYRRLMEGCRCAA